MGAEEAFADFVSARWSRLYHLACILTGEPAAAENLVVAPVAPVSWA